MPTFGIDNSIGWAHWRLKGGWKNAFITTLCYSGVIGGLIVMFVQSRPRHQPATDILAGWRIALLVIQAGILIMYGGSRVASAVRSDITLGMIESHRLMPVGPVTAVSGYLWGPTAQVVILAGANFLIGILVTLGAELDIGVWLGPNFVLVTFALFIWVVAAYAASIAKAAWGMVFGMLLAVAFSQGFFLAMLPAAQVLVSPSIGATVFQARMSNYEFGWPMVMSFSSQFCIGTILYFGAARKYRRSEDTALAIGLGMLLLTFWVASSAGGIIWQEDLINPMLFRNIDVRQDVILISSIISSMLIALAPIANAARDARARPYSPLIAIGCALIISLLALVSYERGDPWLNRAAATVLIVAALLVSVCYLLRIIYRVVRKGWGLAAGWLTLFSAVPMLVDMAAWVMSESTLDFDLTTISSFSPLGSLIMIWNDSTEPVWFGIACQTALAAGWAILFYATRRKAHA